MRIKGYYFDSLIAVVAFAVAFRAYLTGYSVWIFVYIGFGVVNAYWAHKGYKKSLL